MTPSHGYPKPIITPVSVLLCRVPSAPRVNKPIGEIHLLTVLYLLTYRVRGSYVWLLGGCISPSSLTTRFSALLGTPRHISLFRQCVGPVLEEALIVGNPVPYLARIRGVR